jgi:hypothetical protein
MKKLISLFIITSWFASCKKEYVQINVVFPNELEVGARIHKLKISSQDTVIPLERGRKSIFFSKGDTLTLYGLPPGTYTLSYLDLLGKTKKDKVTLNDGDNVFLKPKPLDVDVTPFYNRTPINNIKDGEHYMVIATGPYSGPIHTIYRVGNKLYCEGYNEEKKLLSDEKSGYIKQFEAELFAIQGVNISWSTGRWYYYIIKGNDTLRLVDNTGMWGGWKKWYPKIRK